MASSRYRDRHAVSGAKSDPGDAKVLADLVRTDRHNHRPVAGDSDLVEGVKIIARAHQSAIWARQRQLNALRSASRVLPRGARCLRDRPVEHRRASQSSASPRRLSSAVSSQRSKIASALRRGGRSAQHRTAQLGRSKQRSRAEYLEAPKIIAEAYGPITRSAMSPHRGLQRPRSARSKRRSRSILSSTRTPRSSAPYQDWGRSSAPGCWASSVMTGLVSPVPSLARTTPARRRSPRPRATATWCSLVSRATAALRRARPVGLLLAHKITGRSALLRRAASPWQDPSPSSAPARQPMGRDPPHLSSARGALRRTNRLATPEVGRRLTSYGHGVSRVCARTSIGVVPSRSRSLPLRRQTCGLVLAVPAGTPPSRSEPTLSSTGSRQRNVVSAATRFSSTSLSSPLALATSSLARMLMIGWRQNALCEPRTNQRRERER